MLTKIQNMILEGVRDDVISRPSGPITPNVNFANSTFAITPRTFAADGIESATIAANLEDVNGNKLEGRVITLSKGSILVGIDSSFVSVSKTVMEDDGVDTVFIDIQLKFPGDGAGSIENFPADLVNIVVDGGLGNVVTQASGRTDVDGIFQSGASFTTTSLGPKTVKVYVGGALLTSQPVVYSGSGVDSIVDISRDAASTAGGVRVSFEVTNPRGTIVILFGANPCTDVTIDSSNQVSGVIPAGTTGVVDITINGVAFVNPRAAKIGGDFEYLPAPVTTLIDTNFEGGSFTGTGLQANIVSNGGAVTITDEQAYSGTYSVKCTGLLGDSGTSSFRNSTNIDVSAYANGVYVRYYYYMPLATAEAVTGTSDQIKSFLFRRAAGDGQPGWIMTGIGSAFPDGGEPSPTFVSFIDNGILNINGTPNEGRSGEPSGTWVEFIYWQKWLGATGRCKQWVNGRLLFDVTDANLGSANTDYRLQLGIAHQEHPEADTEVFVDGVFTGDGFPTPLTPNETPAVPFFTDGFEGGVRNDGNGFTWTSTTSRVSVQTAPDSSGDYALRFRFGPDASGGDSSAEQRFNLGRDLTEIWLDYFVWIPSNYQHRNELTGGDNNKFFRLWGDDYNSVMKVGASTMPTAAVGATNDESNLTNEFNRGAGMGQFGPSVAFGGAANLGAWNRIRLHYRRISAEGVADGLAEIWVNSTQIVSTTIDQGWDAATNFWNQGYFFGWSNSGYLAETDFYIRGGDLGLKIYDSDPGWI